MCSNRRKNGLVFPLVSLPTPESDSLSGEFKVKSPIPGYVYFFSKPGPRAVTGASNWSGDWIMDYQKLFFLSVDRPLLVIFTALIAVFACVAGAKKLVFEGDVRFMFSADDAQRMALEKVESVYGSTDTGVVVLEFQSDTLYNKEHLTLLRQVTDRAWGIPSVTRVDSAANYQYSWAVGDELYVESLVDDVKTLDRAAVERVRTVVEKEPSLQKSMVSSDGRAASVNLDFTFMDDTPEAEVKAMERIISLKETIEAGLPDVKVHLGGTVVNAHSSNEASTRDLMKYLPVMFLVEFGIMALFLRTIGGVVGAFAVVVLSILSTLGLAGWAGVRLDILSASFIQIVITVGIAHCIHLLVNFHENFNEETSKREAIIKTLEMNFRPVFLTSLTTVLGFSSMNLSSIPPVRNLGNIASLGGTATFVLSMVLLPAFLSLLPMRRHKLAGRRRQLEKLAEFVIRHRKATLAGSCLLAGAFIALMPLNQINDRYTKYLDESNQYRKYSDFIDGSLAGLGNIQYALNSGEPGGISDPEYLRHLSEFTAWLRAQPEISNVLSYSDTIKRLNMNMHGDDPGFYRVPDSRELAAQYLFLYELSLPKGLDMRRQISPDQSSTRLTVTFPSMDSRRMWALQEKIDRWMNANLPEYMRHEGASVALMFAHVGSTVMISSIHGAVLALTLISIVLIVALRSFKYGLISLIPNLFPAGIGFGIWAVTNGYIGMNLAIVLGVTIGIVVDDTVHFLLKYISARKIRQLSAEDSVRETLPTVGVAMSATTCALVAGFAVLSQSSYQPLHDGAILIGTIISVALLLDLSLLPALLLVFDKKVQTGTLSETRKNQMIMRNAHVQILNLD